MVVGLSKRCIRVLAMGPVDLCVDWMALREDSSSMVGVLPKSKPMPNKSATSSKI